MGRRTQGAAEPGGSRTVSLKSFAKINLDLRVLYKRADGYHELRTVFQTISLADGIRIRFTPARRSRLVLEGNIDIPNNLVLRAAEVLLRKTSVKAEVSFHLTKTIPMGAGLGGGSSNAAAVLLALPVLAGMKVPFERLVEMGAALGSDVPFFLYGGSALGVGRGAELYPLSDLRGTYGLLLAPPVHVTTAEAYGDLRREPLTSTLPTADTESFQALVWAMSEARLREDWKQLCTNDFETTVFRRYPALQSMKRKLGRFGASPALMTGSGSALFGLFNSRERRENAFHAFSR